MPAQILCNSRNSTVKFLKFVDHVFLECVLVYAWSVFFNNKSAESTEQL